MNGHQTTQIDVSAAERFQMPVLSPLKSIFRTNRRQAFRRDDSLVTIADVLNSDEKLSPRLGAYEPFPSVNTLSRYSTGYMSPIGRSTTSLVKRKSPYDTPSTRVPPGTVLPKPWVGKATRLVYARYIIYLGCLLGLGLAGLVCYLQWASVPHLGPVTLVFEDLFDTLDPAKWNHEISVGGFGNGEFEWTTNSTANSYVSNATLYILPTLTEDVLTASQITNGYTVNLTADGTCTFASEHDCIVTSNSSTGKIINPVQSARLTTLHTGSIRFGKVEVEARMPKGDWIWPAIWMLPVNNTYGEWPLSGEIDIAESRGNDVSYKQGGRDVVSSSLHWGPAQALDRYYLTTGSMSSEKVDYTEDFFTYGFEWTPDYMMIYVNSRIRQTFALKSKKQSFWERGKFPSTYYNESTLIDVSDPWVESKNNVSPFDQGFYLILSVGVGGTNGWFPDDMGGKTWNNADLNPAGHFYNTTSSWKETWPEDPSQRALAVRSVRMWQSDQF